MKSRVIPLFAEPLHVRRRGQGGRLGRRAVRARRAHDLRTDECRVQGARPRRRHAVAAIAQALAEGAGSFFKWGQARHLPLPLCWEVAGRQKPGAANTNQCTESGEEGWCGGE